MPEEWSRETGRERNKSARTAREQVGSGKSRMRRVTEQVPACSIAPPLQFKREHQTCELRLPICLPWRVHPCALQIIEIDGAGTVRQAADADDPWPACPAQQRHQPSGESEVTQMVCSKLHLKAIRRGLPAGQRHDARIIDQEIKGMPGVHPLREVGDRCKAGQIEMFVAYLGAGHFAADLLESRLSLLIVATGQNDLRTGLGQGQRRLVTETARGPSDNGRSAELRRDLACVEPAMKEPA